MPSSSSNSTTPYLHPSYSKVEKTLPANTLLSATGRIKNSVNPKFAAAYCLDLCRTNDGIKIVEVNTINSAGFYDANVTKLIEAFTDIYWREEQ